MHTTNRALWATCALYFLGFMHFFMSHRGGAALDLPFNAWGWMFASVVAGLGLWLSAQRKALVWTPLQGAWWLAAFFMVLPLLYPGQEVRAYAIPRLLGLLAGLLVLLALAQWSLDARGRERLMYLVLGGVAIEAVLGIVQFFFFGPNNFMGYDARLNRPTGIFQQVNVMASFMATGLMMAAWLEARAALAPPAASTDRRERVKAQALSALRWGVMAAAGFLLVLVQSRAGLLGAALGLLLLAPHLQQRRRLGRVLLLVALGVALALLCQWLGAGAEGKGAAQRGVQAYTSVGVRTAYWAQGLKMIAESPWVGWGYGRFEAAFLEFYMAAKQLDPALPDLGGMVTHPHNEFLYWAIEGGLLPVLGLLIMGLAVLWRLLQAPHWRQACALLALVFPMLLYSQTEYPFYLAAVLWLVFIILVHVIDAEVEDLALAAGRPASLRTSAYRPAWLVRGLALLVPLTVLPFMLTTLHTLRVLHQYETGRYQNPELMHQVINPVGLLSRVEFGVYTPQLIGAFMTGNMAVIQAYADWAQLYIKHTPRPAVYVGLMQALTALGRLSEAEAVRNHGLLLYPHWQGLQASDAGGASASGATRAASSAKSDPVSATASSLALPVGPPVAR
jgi:O-antigen polymerase